MQLWFYSRLQQLRQCVGNKVTRAVARHFTEQATEVLQEQVDMNNSGGNWRVKKKKKYIYIYIYTHTHTQIYIYIHT